MPISASASRRSCDDSLLKSIVVISAAVALACVLELGAGGAMPRLAALGATAFALAFLGGVLAPTGATVAVLVACYLTPAAYQLFVGVYLAHYFVVWLAAAFGLVLATSNPRQWHMGPLIRWPIATWSLMVACVWPVVALRECDFSLEALHDPRTANTSVGIHPAVAVLIIATSVAAQLIGFLLFDWLFARFGRDRAGFERVVLRALGAAWLVSTAIGLYQVTMDIGFLNAGAFPSAGRASGSFADANPFGMISAVWGPAAVALVLSRRDAPDLCAIVFLLLASWFGLWGSGSRNALLVGVLGTAVVAWELWHTLPTPSRRVLLGAGAAATTCVVAFVLLTSGVVTSPIARLRETFGTPEQAKASPVARLEHMWDPYGYGAVARAMLHDSPWVGVGIGVFPMMAPDYGRRTGYIHITFDNAQNYFRHQLVENGIVGMLPILVWTGVYVWLLTRGRRVASTPPATFGIVRVLPVLFVAGSLVGMPPANVPVAMTFWMFAFWYLACLPDGPVVAHALDRSVWFRWAGAVALGIVVVQVAGTWATARDGMRVPVRAQRFGWDYSYGFYPPDPQGVRIARRRALAVIDAPKRWIALTYWVNHFDIVSNPVEVLIRLDDHPIESNRLKDVAPVTVYARVPKDESRVIVDTAVSRTLRPSDVGIPDTREIGLFVKWDFVDTPPLDGMPRSR